MADASFEFEGADPEDLADSLENFERVLGDELEAAAEDIALRIEADAKRKAPVDSGRLQGSIASEAERVSEAVVRAVIGSNVEYAPFVEMGTDPHPITGDPLAWEGGGGEMQFATEVQHPGTPAQPFLRPAVEQNRSYVRERVAEAVENAAEKVS